MAKLIADLEGNTMMREPEPMPIIYRFDGGDYGADLGDYGSSDADFGIGGDVGGPEGDSTGGLDYSVDEDVRALEQEDREFGDTFDPLYVGDIGGPTFEEQEKAARDFIEFERDLYQSNQKDYLDRFETGKLTEAEDLLLTQLNQGRTGPEAGGLFASLMAVPGVKDAVEKGYSSGLKYGSLLQDALAVREQSLANLAEQVETARLAQDEQADQERDQFFDDDTVFVEPEESVFDKFLGGVKDYFTGPSERDLIEMDMAVKGAGMTFDPLSDASKYASGAISLFAPGPIGPAKSLADLLAFATNSRVIGTINTPYGPFQLTEAGAIQSPSDLDLTTQVGFGNEPVITKKRKVTTEKPKEEKKKEESKEGFPQQKLPRLTPSDQTELANIYGSDDPLFNKYATGIQALV